LQDSENENRFNVAKVKWRNSTAETVFKNYR